MNGQTQDYTLTVGGGGPNGAAINVALPFPAQSVAIDNLTNQYVLIGGDVQRFVPPGRSGVVLPMFGSRKAQASFTSPPGQTAPPAAVNGQIARLVFSELPLPNDRGIDPATGLVRSYGPFIWTAPPAGGNAQLTLPDGTQRIIVPNDCWISRIYGTLAIDCIAGPIVTTYTKNQFGGAVGISFPAPVPLTNILFDQFGAPLANPTNNHFWNYSGLPPSPARFPGWDSNMLVAGDFVAVFGVTLGGFAPFGAGQVYSVYLETTDNAV